MATFAIGDPTTRTLIDNYSHLNNVTTQLGIGFLTGYSLDWVGAQSITISPGHCHDSTGTFLMSAQATMTVSFNTTTVNGLDTGVITASRLYSLWVIDGDFVSVGALASLDATSPTMPTGYTRRRRIGWASTDATPNVLEFHQIGVSRSRFTKFDLVQSFFTTLTTHTGYLTVTASSLIPPQRTLAQVQFRFTQNPAGAGKAFRIKPEFALDVNDVSRQNQIQDTGGTVASWNVTHWVSFRANQSVVWLTNQASQGTTLLLSGYWDQI